MPKTTILKQLDKMLEGLTVAQLIEQLQLCDPAAKVYLYEGSKTAPILYVEVLPNGRVVID